LPQQWKEFIILPIYEKDDKSDGNYYRGMSFRPTTYKSVSNMYQGLFPWG